MAEAEHHRALTAVGLPADGPGCERLSWAGVEAWLLLARSRTQPLADTALAIRTALALAALGHRPDAEDAFFTNEAFDAALPHVVSVAPEALEPLRPRLDRLKVFFRVLAAPDAEQDALTLDVLQDFHDEAAMLADVCDFLHRRDRLAARGARLDELEAQFAATRVAAGEPTL